MRFAYKRRGGPLLDWDGRTAPYQSRAGETRSLGGLGSLELDVPRPGAPEIVSGYESPHPNAALIHFGADEKAAPAKFDTGLIRKASALAAAYHGVRRNNGSILWGLVWAAAAFVSPLYGTLVPAFAMAQGFGEARAKSNPAGSKSERNRRKWRRLAAAKRPRKHGPRKRALAAKKGWQGRRRRAGWKAVDMKRGYRK
jgi:hypothetical protein